MSEPTLQLYRFPCPHCQRVLKAPFDWAGRTGNCPACHQAIIFPASALSVSPSKTVQVLLSLVTPDENAHVLEEPELGKLALLLAQGTCVEFSLAKKLLAGRTLPTRLWRRVLRGAAKREKKRIALATQPTSIFEALESGELDASGSMTGVSMADPAHATLDAWTILVRFIHATRHGTCPACQNDITGLCCIYQTFEYFATTQSMTSEKQEKWKKYATEIYGLKTE